jgi:hypothetical protein
MKLPVLIGEMFLIDAKKSYISFNLFKEQATSSQIINSRKVNQLILNERDLYEYI